MWDEFLDSSVGEHVTSDLFRSDERRWRLLALTEEKPCCRVTGVIPT
jgi:hypothetical protein